MISENEIWKLAELAREKLNEKIRREEAILALQKAGILDSKEAYTKPYAHLANTGSSKQIPPTSLTE